MTPSPKFKGSDPNTNVANTETISLSDDPALVPKHYETLKYLSGSEKIKVFPERKHELNKYKNKHRKLMSLQITKSSNGDFMKSSDMKFS